MCETMGEPSRMTDGENLICAVPLDAGLLASVSVLRFLDEPTDSAQLNHQFASEGETFTAVHMPHAAKRLKLKARSEPTSRNLREKATLPSIASPVDSGFALLARVATDRILLRNLRGCRDGSR